MPAPGVILYIASQLPKRSETFVYREVLSLRAAGRRVLAASVHPPERDLGDPQLDALADEAVGIYGPGVGRMLLDAALEKWTHLPRALGTFWQALRDAWRNEDVRGLAKLKVIWQGLAALALARRIRKLGVTHIHAHMAHVPATMAMYAARQLGIPFSFTGHAADLFRDRALLKPKLERAAFVSCISEWHREFYRTILPRPDDAYPVIRCGVDTGEFSVSARTEAVVPLILGVGRLVPKKGFDVLIQALAKLRAEGVAFRAVIGGDGPEAANLIAMRARHEMSDVIEMPGAMTNARVRAMLAGSGLFVLPCKIDASGDRDGIPVVLMEAMACGVPCVSGDLPAIRELVGHGHTGHLVQPGDAAALAESLKQILADSHLHAAMSAASRARIEEEFSSTVNTARLQLAFDRAGAT